VRRTVLVAAVVLALAGAAGAGAVVQYTIHRIQPGDYADLGDARVSCEFLPPSDDPKSGALSKRFVCFRIPGSLPTEDYGAAIGRFGVWILHWSATKDSRPTYPKKYCNPGTKNCATGKT
jgi:hypothetical protein